MEPNVVIAVKLLRRYSAILSEYCASPASKPVPPVVAWCISESIKNALSIIPETE